MNMKYESLYREFCALFPSHQAELDALARAALAEEEDGMHIMFGDVVVPFVLNLLRNDSEKELCLAFDFFEKMDTSGDAEIAEVLEFTVIESLMSHGKAIFEKAYNHMGPETKESCKAIARYLKVGGDDEKGVTHD